MTTKKQLTQSEISAFCQPGSQLTTVFPFCGMKRRTNRRLPCFPGFTNLWKTELPYMKHSDPPVYFHPICFI